MNRFERSWSLFRSSLAVILRNKELLIFPVITSIASVVVFLFFFAPAVLWPTGHSYLTAEHWHALADKYFTKTGQPGPHEFSLSPVAIAYSGLLYFVSMFVATFFNVAFYHEILAALNGEAVSLSRGLSFAVSRWKAIVMWTLFAGLIGLLIKLIEERLDFVGKIIARLVGVAWSIASVFVIPVMVRDEETSNPITMVKKSAEILTSTWGESLIGYVGIGIINSVVFFGSAVALALGIIVTTQIHNYLLMGLIIGGWVIAMICWSYLMNVANLVYKGALYLYASEGILAEPYDEEALHTAWRFKKIKA